MTNRYKKAVIEDVTSHGIDAAEQSNLLDLFEYAMKSIAPTLAREAKFDTTDFATAKQRACDGYQLLIQRIYSDERITWRGEFTKPNQHLTVIGLLE